MSHKIHGAGSKTTRSAEHCSPRRLQRMSASPNSSHTVQEILDTGGLQSQRVNLWLVMFNLDCQDWLWNQPRDVPLDGSVTAFPRRINRRGLRRKGPPQSVWGGGGFRQQARHEEVQGTAALHLPPLLPTGECAHIVTTALSVCLPMQIL